MSRGLMLDAVGTNVYTAIGYVRESAHNPGTRWQ